MSAAALRRRRDSVYVAHSIKETGKHIDQMQACIKSSSDLSCHVSHAITQRASRFSTASTLRWGRCYSMQLLVSQLTQHARIAYDLNSHLRPTGTSAATAVFPHNEVHFQEEDARCAQCWCHLRRRVTPCQKLCLCSDTRGMAPRRSSSARLHASCRRRAVLQL